MSPRIVVTAGPSIAAEQVRAHVPAAEVVAPIRFGDAYGYGLAAGDTLVVVDGLFWQSASVRHRELLDLIDAEVTVYGCSSMGALRAAELTELGMIGYGEVFAAYRSGAIVGDDEVGVVHGLAEDGYAVGVDALVNTRATLAAAVTAGLTSQAEADQVLLVATTRCFTDRSWGALLHAAEVPTSKRLLDWLRTRPVDVKRTDATGLLALLGGGIPAAEIAGQGDNAPTPSTAPGPSGYSATWAWHLPTAAEPAASPGDVIELAAVLDPGYADWRNTQMLRQLAAAELDNDRPPGRDDRGRAPSGIASTPQGVTRPDGVPETAWQAWCARESTLSAHLDADLTLLAAQSLARTGILEAPDAALPVELEHAWVYGDERSLCTLARNSLVATRTVAVDRNSQLGRSLLVDLALAGRLVELAESVARIRSEFAEKAPGYTGALSEKGWEVVRDRLARHWGEDYDQALRRRGLRELPELGIMLALVDLA